MRELAPVNPFADASYWSALREEQRLDATCPDCGEYAIPDCPCATDAERYADVCPLSYDYKSRCQCSACRKETGR